LYCVIRSNISNSPQKKKSVSAITSKSWVHDKNPVDIPLTRGDTVSVQGSPRARTRDTATNERPPSSPDGGANSLLRSIRHNLSRPLCGCCSRFLSPALHVLQKDTHTDSCTLRTCRRISSCCRFLKSAEQQQRSGIRHGGELCSSCVDENELRRLAMSRIVNQL
jgi:hypothetical protein